jgi:hypothetical protein
MASVSALCFAILNRASVIFMGGRGCMDLPSPAWRLSMKDHHHAVLGTRIVSRRRWKQSHLSDSVSFLCFLVSPIIRFRPQPAPSPSPSPPSRCALYLSFLPFIAPSSSHSSHYARSVPDLAWGSTSRHLPLKPRCSARWNPVCLARFSQLPLPFLQIVPSELLRT